MTHAHVRTPGAAPTDPATSCFRLPRTEAWLRSWTSGVPWERDPEGTWALLSCLTEEKRGRPQLCEASGLTSSPTTPSTLPEPRGGLLGTCLFLEASSTQQYWGSHFTSLSLSVLTCGPGPGADSRQHEGQSRGEAQALQVATSPHQNVTSGISVGTRGCHNRFRPLAEVRDSAKRRLARPPATTTIPHTRCEESKNRQVENVSGAAVERLWWEASQPLDLVSRDK